MHKSQVFMEWFFRSSSNFTDTNTWIKRTNISQQGNSDMVCIKRLDHVEWPSQINAATNLQLWTALRE